MSIATKAFIILGSALLSSAAFAKTPLTGLLGTWVLRDPALRMMTSYTEVGLSQLKLWQPNAVKPCQRRAFFWYEEDRQRIGHTTVAVDPSNPKSCAAEPGMNKGDTVYESARIENDILILMRATRTGPLLSAWERVDSSGDTANFEE